MADNLMAPSDNVEPPKDYLNELVGDNKKFKSPEELARGKWEADNYVKTLEGKLDELRSDFLKEREENVSRANLEQLIRRLETAQTQPSNTQPEVRDVNTPQQIDSKQIESLVSTKIQEFELSKKQTDNFNTVKSKLIEQFGNNYQVKLKEQIETLGLSEDDANALARKSPAAFLRTLGMDQPTQQNTFQAPPRSDVRSNFQPTGAAKRTWSYYQQMKKDNPKAYYDPKTNIQMHNDAVALGDSFQDGDYNAL
jgi:hypothetical protein